LSVRYERAARKGGLFVLDSLHHDPKNLSPAGLTRGSIAVSIAGMSYYVYMLASAPNGTLYIGMSNDLVRRVWQHQQGAAESFTKKYDVTRLVYFETYDDIRDAQQRERTMKHWKRDWKIALIEKDNPDWRDLYDGIAR
jgi:putative endonuclease